MIFETEFHCVPRVRRVILVVVAAWVVCTAAAAQTLTAVATSGRAITAGGSITHVISLTMGSTPMANKTIAIYDPVQAACIAKLTNSTGQITHVTATASSTPAKPYTFVFKYGATQTTSSVAVRLASGVTLPNYMIGLVSTSAPPNSTLAVGQETVGSGLIQATVARLNEGVQFGRAVVSDYLSNPGNALLVGVASVSCPATVVAPPSGAICAVSVKMITAGLAVTTVKVLVKRWIDATSWPAADKQSAKALVDLGNCALSIARFSPDGALTNVSALSSSWTCGSALGQFVKSGSTMTSGSVAGIVNGTNEVLQVSFCRR